MVISGRPHRRSPIRWTTCLLLAFVATGLARPRIVPSGWSVTYPAATNGRSTHSAAVPVNDPSTMVTVVLPGGDASRPALRNGSLALKTDVIGYDPVSRLCFLRVKGTPPPNAPVWLDKAASCIGAPLQARTPGGLVKCRATGWVKQVRGKILPLALLRVTFDHAVPVAGTPLADASGRVVGLVFQAAGGDQTGYAIPTEAVQRVQRDITSRGHVARGWLGLSLRAENPAPRIVRILPDSPASQSGLRPGDVLQHVGARPISDYSDAVNAFFYLSPGQPVKIRFLRGVEPLEVALTPVVPQPQ